MLPLPMTKQNNTHPNNGNRIRCIGFLLRYDLFSVSRQSNGIDTSINDCKGGKDYMLSVRTVRMTVLTVAAFGVGWLAKTNAQQKVPAPSITYFSHQKVEASFVQALATTGGKDLFTRKDRQGRTWAAPTNR